ncbi:MAG: serine hydrolase domain-containing protein [Bryobacteraceae bacterium]
MRKLILRSLIAFVLSSQLAPAQEVFGKIDSISASVEQIRAKYAVPGVSVAVFRDFELLWAKGYGVANLDTKQPVDSFSLFQAASISKPVAAVAAVRLAQDGRLDLTRNINEYLTTWKLPENDLTRATPVTLSHLMSHTAGLTIHGFPGYEASAPIPTVPHVLDGQKPANTEAVRVTVAPGTKFEYSGGGYTILQQLLIDVTHQTFPDLMRARVLDHAGMRFSTYQQPVPANLVRYATSGHEKGKVIQGERHVYPEMAAAGLWTTPSDLARFAMSIQRARLGMRDAILSKQMAQLMTTPFIPGSFGLGFEMLRPQDKEKKYFGHTGGNAGYRCMLLATLEGGNGVVVMINGDDFKAVSEITGKIVAEYGW